MEYITIKDGRVAGHFCGKTPDGGVEVFGFEGKVGDDVRKFDAAWRLRPLPELVAEGLEEVPRGFKLDGGVFVEMNQVEKIEAGLERMPPGMKIEANGLVAMSDGELLDAGLITREEFRRRERAPLERELRTLDEMAVRPLRAMLAGTGTDEDAVRLAEIEGLARAVRARLAGI